MIEMTNNTAAYSATHVYSEVLMVLVPHEYESRYLSCFGKSLPSHLHENILPFKISISLTFSNDDGTVPERRLIF